jgi:hypothetical protein
MRFGTGNPFNSAERAVEFRAQRKKVFVCSVLPVIQTDEEAVPMKALGAHPRHGGR